MTAEIRLTITPGEGVTVEGMDARWGSEGVDPGDVPMFVLAAVEALIQVGILEALSTEMPMLNGDILDALASTNARLAVMHEIMHVPAQPAQGITTTY